MIIGPIASDVQALLQAPRRSRAEHGSEEAALSCHGVTPSERSVGGGDGARFGGPFRRDVTSAAWQANPRQDLDMARAGSDS
ncbi:hypothetical protein ALC56_10078 [Trachymyrmex septentrionalis]|uniref:Uncharacterized protein n=1 Tax=Trachymyrmex septentrionalis TaxID=34720 RepID=A0A195F549_9HYME|nr:hypothetical protein ALC56_10078 [Trachymyrmex septentrionalis]